MTYTKTGYFGYAGGGKNGAIVDAWLVSRFGGTPPQENSAPPSGVADAGPVTTATTFGGPGAYTLTLPIVADYYVRVQYGGNSYWSTITSGSIQGGGGGGAGALLAANNLSDLVSVPTAQTNLGLGTAALQPTSAFLQPANNLSDVASATTSLTNLGQRSVAYVDNFGGGPTQSAATNTTAFLNAFLYLAGSTTYPGLAVWASGTTYTTGNYVYYSGSVYQAVTGSTGQTPVWNTTGTYWAWVADCAGGTIAFGGGIYQVNNLQPLDGPGWYVVGAGMNYTTLKSNALGDTLRLYTSYWSNRYPNQSAPLGGGVADLIVDGSGLGAGMACGIHLGDANYYRTKSIACNGFGWAAQSVQLVTAASTSFTLQERGDYAVSATINNSTNTITAAQLATILNATPSGAKAVTQAPGVTVTGPTGGPWYVTFNAPGPHATFTPSAGTVTPVATGYTQIGLWFDNVGSSASYVTYSEGNWIEATLDNNATSVQFDTFSGVYNAYPAQSFDYSRYEFEIQTTGDFMRINNGAQLFGCTTTIHGDAFVPPAATTNTTTTGTLLSALSTLPVTNLSGWPSHGIAQIATTDGQLHWFSYSGISGSSLTGCVFSGPTSAAVTAGGWVGYPSYSAILRLTGSNTMTSYLTSQYIAGSMSIDVEIHTADITPHYTVFFGSGVNGIYQGVNGHLNFLINSPQTTNYQTVGAGFEFAGSTIGDSVLGSPAYNSPVWLSTIPMASSQGGGQGVHLYSGTGAPTFKASTGDFYFRVDGAGTATIYTCTSGSTPTWLPANFNPLVGATTTHTAAPGETTIAFSGTFTVTLPAPGSPNIQNRVVNVGIGTVTVQSPSGNLYTLTNTTAATTLTQGVSALFACGPTDWFRIA